MKQLFRRLKWFPALHPSRQKAVPLQTTVKLPPMYLRYYWLPPFSPPPGNSGTNNSPRHNHFIHTHTTMPVLYTAMVGQEHKMGIVIQTLIHHLINELAYFHIRLFNGTYIFGGHPFVLMPCMVSMDRIEKDQGRTVPVFH